MNLFKKKPKLMAIMDYGNKYNIYDMTKGEEMFERNLKNEKEYIEYLQNKLGVGI